MAKSRDVNGMKVESDVPIPSRAVGHGNRKYPFVDMKAGESVLVNEPLAKFRGSVTYAQLAIGNGARFMCRTVEGGVRVWRIS